MISTILQDSPVVLELWIAPTPLKNVKPWCKNRKQPINVQTIPGPDFRMQNIDGKDRNMVQTYLKHSIR